MVKTLLRIVLIGITIGALYAQAPPVQWDRVIPSGAWGEYVQQTSDKGYVVAGSKLKSGGDVDIYLLKTDSLGNPEWERTFGSQVPDGASSVQQTRDGGYIIAGGGDDTGKTYLVKTDSFGNFQWKFSKYIWTCAYGVQQTYDGGYIVAGAWSGSEGGIYIMKIDSLGNFEWNKIFPESYKDWVAFFPVQQTRDSGYIIGAEALIKTDSLGNIQWRRTYNKVFVLFSVQQTTDGGYITTGIGENEANPRQWCQICLLKTNSLGNQVWKKTFGSSGKAQGRCVKQTQDGGYFISGDLSGDAYVLKTNSLGNLQWATLLGVENKWATCGQQTADGGYIIIANDHLIKLAPSSR